MPASTAIKVACFNCGSNSTRVFHSVDNIPVHSCLLMPSRQEAVDYPRGDLRVAFCDDCGFIQNSAFDPAVHEYSQRYEETQAFSAKFVDFAREVCEDYGRKYSLADKTVLEIGCGKGEFLVMLCELTGARGIGIDPGYRPERTTSPAADRLEFIVDFYSEKYTHLAADMVLCRHTLEHIQPTKEFMSMVRRSIGDRQGTIVAFELPDMERILEEQAFWDIYYEHCSYFTLGSLSRLFKSCGFEVLELAKCYDGQYLLIDARPGEHPEGKVLPGEDDLPRLRQLVDEFETKLAEKMT
ncbi:MAG: class I SAM-dependent methyltransferase, partial [Planctomycetota bacterium]